MKKHAINIGLLVLSTTLGVLFIELGLRTFWSQNLSLSYKTRDGMKILRPGHKGVFTGVETTQGYKINSFGMRDREHRLKKENGNFRILLLGDSFMEALQVKFKHSFVERLEKKLDESIQKRVQRNSKNSAWTHRSGFSGLQPRGRESGAVQKFGKRICQKDTSPQD